MQSELRERERERKLCMYVFAYECVPAFTLRTNCNYYKYAHILYIHNYIHTRACARVCVYIDMYAHTFTSCNYIESFRKNLYKPAGIGTSKSVILAWLIQYFFK